MRFRVLLCFGNEFIICSCFLTFFSWFSYKNSIINVQVDDKMFLVSDTVIINESTLRKWGFNVGSITLTIVR